jgi:hypothetical protein
MCPQKLEENSPEADGVRIVTISFAQVVQYYSHNEGWRKNN